MSGDYPREPVPDEAANRPALPITLIVASAIMGVPVMILGASLGLQYGLGGAAFVIVTGCVVTALIAALASYAGVKSRRSAALLARETFGSSGAHLLNAALSVALLGWLAVELGFIGAMLSDGLATVAGYQWGRTPGIVVASLLICIFSISGISWISRAPLLFLPFLFVLLLAVLGLTIQQHDVFSLASPPARSIGTGVSAIVGGYIIGCLIMPDYSRFVRSSRAAVAATITALGPIYALMLGTYALAGLATQAGNPVNILVALGLPAFLSLLLPIGLLQNGIMSLYSSALASSTVVTAVSFRTIVIATAVAGTVLALIGADALFVAFLVTLGIVFPPAMALIICAGLFREVSEAARWRWDRLLVWGGGAAMGASSEWLHFGLTGYSALDGFAVAAAGAITLHYAGKANLSLDRAGPS